MEPIISGFTFGITLAFLLGPVFFTLIQTSLHEGFRAGLMFASGVFISDTFLIGACYLFASKLNLMTKYPDEMGIIGGIVLASFGIFQFIKKTKVKEVDNEKRTLHSRFALHGFLLNTLNPMVLLFWLSVVSIVTARQHYTTLNDFEFFASLLLTVAGTDVLKSYLSHKLKRLLKANVMHRINQITGIILIGFGGEMIARVLFHY